MRNIIVTALVAGGLALVSAMPAHAARRAFCLQGDEYPGWSFCNYDTYASCQATASGINAYCVAYPFYQGQSDDPYAYQNRPRRYPPSQYPPAPGYYPR